MPLNCSPLTKSSHSISSVLKLQTALMTHQKANFPLPKDDHERDPGYNSDDIEELDRIIQAALDLLRLML